MAREGGRGEVYFKLGRMDAKLDRILEVVLDIQENQMTQEQLDNYVQSITVALDGIRQDIADLKAQAPANLDFSSLEERVSGMENLDAENPQQTSPPA